MLAPVDTLESYQGSKLQSAAAYTRPLARIKSFPTRGLQPCLIAERAHAAPRRRCSRHPKRGRLLPRAAPRTPPTPRAAAAHMAATAPQTPLLLDPSIRDWVVLPMVAIMVLMNLMRH